MSRLQSLLMGTAVALILGTAFTKPAPAGIIANLGVNPSSGQGAFESSPGGGLFEDQFTFQLVGGPVFITIANATNVYPRPTDFITNYSAAVYSVGADGIVNNGDDVAVIGPVGATACVLIQNCQVVGGSALLNPGNYYLEFTGSGGGTSGYGGNLAVAAVPGPILGGGLPGLVMAIGGLFGWRRWRKV